MVFREVKTIPRQEVQPREEGLETVEFELEDEKSDSIEEDELEEEEPQTPALRRLVWERRQPERYTPPESLGRQWI